MFRVSDWGIVCVLTLTWVSRLWLLSWMWSLTLTCTHTHRKKVIQMKNAIAPASDDCISSINTHVMHVFITQTAAILKSDRMRPLAPAVGLALLDAYIVWDDEKTNFSLFPPNVRRCCCWCRVCFVTWLRPLQVVGSCQDQANTFHGTLFSLEFFQGAKTGFLQIKTKTMHLKVCLVKRG